MESKVDLNIHSIGTPSIMIDVLPDNHLVICAANSAAEQLFSAINDKVEGMILTDFNGLDANEITRRQDTILHVKRCIDHKAPTFSEAEQHSHDGSSYSGRRAYTPIINANGKVEKVLLMSFDISELIESQQELKLVIDSIGAPILVVDAHPDNRFFWRFFNPSAEEFYNLSNDRFKGLEIGDFENVADYRIAFRKRLLDRCKNLTVAKKPLLFENEYNRPEGRRWARTTYVPIFSPTGEVSQIMITSLDITELIETQRNLENALTKTLSGFVTICANCKKIKHKQEWQPIEQYASEQMDYHSFSHGICGTCKVEFYGDEIQES